MSMIRRLSIICHTLATVSVIPLNDGNSGLAVTDLCHFNNIR